jgi:signal transduction histidine kinase
MDSLTGQADSALFAADRVNWHNEADVVANLPICVAPRRFKRGYDSLDSLRGVVSMPKTVVDAQEDQDFILLNLAPNMVQKRLALGVVLFLFIAFLIVAGPLSNLQLARINSFIPIYGTAMLVNDSITAVLLFAQFSIVRSRAVVVIASGYLFTALILIPWMLTFPGVFAPSGLLGAGLQSTSWLYILWHAGFPTFVIAYAVLKDGDPTKRLWHGSVRVAIVSSVAITAAIVCGAAIFVTAGHELLPHLQLDPVHLSAHWRYAAGFIALLIVLAIVVLWIRRHTVLDLWLMVVMCALLVEMGLITFPVAARYTVGWYSGRICGFLSGSLLLFILLYEITTLYGRLLRAVLAQRRERAARLMTGEAVSASIAHEIRQPLSAMIANAGTGFSWLDRAMPDIEEAKAALSQIEVAGHRAADVIESVRAIFKRDIVTRTSLDINELVREALTITRGELQRHEISVQAAPNDQLPRVSGDRVQLQQVLLNLITNAIDSMSATNGKRMLCVKCEVDDNRGVVVSVEDTGAGIDPKDIERIFNPFFTTKSHGMGIGLSICRSIIESHDGKLWVMPKTSGGTAFHFILPAEGSGIC